MPLTVGAEEVLAFLHRTTQPFDRMTIDDARQSLRALSARFSERPERVGSVEDTEVPRGGDSVRVRTYRPAPDPGGGVLPIVVMLHGGGWALGDFDTHDWFCRALCNAVPAVIVAVHYRRTPEHPYPAPLDDVITVLSWASSRAAELSGSSEAPLFVLGDSAGGNLAAAAALVTKDSGPKLSGQVLIYPVLDSRLETPSCEEFREGYFLTAEKLAWYWDMYTPNPEIRSLPIVSPLRSDALTGLPATLVLTAEYDPLRDEGEAYATNLRASGVEATCHRFEGVIHAFTLMSRAIPEAREAVELCAAFIRDRTTARPSTKQRSGE